MPRFDKRIDAYIAKSADFAKPILNHIRAVVHSACPDVEETLKWGMPSFSHHGILCHMAAFKAHAAFGFWKAFTAFQAFLPSMRREYVAWLEEARAEATRERRLATAVEWIADGKQRNWRYQRC